jgi:hypothetical protein
MNSSTKTVATGSQFAGGAPLFAENAATRGASASRLALLGVAVVTNSGVSL